MREIKFRGKRKDNGEWVYGYYYKNPYNQKVYIIDLKDSGIFPVGNIIPGIVGYHEVFPETVGQYIGIKDKTRWEELSEQEQREWLDKGKTKEEWDGREIYGGDIVTGSDYPFIDEGKQNYVGIICWDSSQACFWGCYECVNPNKRGISTGCSFDLYDADKKLKVIGNRHDNPGLLKEKGK